MTPTVHRQKADHTPSRMINNGQQVADHDRVSTKVTTRHGRVIRKPGRFLFVGKAQKGGGRCACTRSQWRGLIA